MKKFFTLALFLAFVTSGAFAMDKAAGGGILFHNIEDNWGTGLFGFLGFHYVEINAGFSMYFDDTFTLQTIQIGIYGKYPIPIGDRLVLFPTVGGDYEFFIGEAASEGVIWLRGGVGIDLFFTERFFLRSHLLAGYGYSALSGLIKVGLGWMF